LGFCLGFKISDLEFSFLRFAFCIQPLAITNKIFQPSTTLLKTFFRQEKQKGLLAFLPHLIRVKVVLGWNINKQFLEFFSLN